MSLPTLERTLTLAERGGEVGRQGGGGGKALSEWVLETWLYYVLMGAVYGAVLGYISLRILRFTLRRCATTLHATHLVTPPRLRPCTDTLKKMDRHRKLPFVSCGFGRKCFLALHIHL